MGAYLDSPIKDKNPENGATDIAKWGVASMQGWRCGMEDAHICCEIKLGNGEKGSLFGVFDGHGGKDVAMFAKAHLKRILEHELGRQTDIKRALETAFLKLDEQVSSEDYAVDTGTTSCVVLITPSEIYCANAGDSRAVLCNEDKAYPLSEDHKPDNAGEQDRIERTSHMVEESRVDGNLALSRAFGDFQYKDSKKAKPEDQAVTAFPDVSVRRRQEGKDDFIILACDGIWDCLSNEECVEDLLNNYIKKQKKEGKELSYAVELLLDEILAPNTEEGIGTDNMTAVLIMLNGGKSLK